MKDDPREAVNSKDYYYLKRKLWVETMTAVCAFRPFGADYVSPEAAADIADEAVNQFRKRFRSVM